MANNKKYWNSLDQLNNDPAFLQEATKEFKEEIPVEEFLGNEGLDSSSTSRRDFLKFVGFSLGAATLAACETPVVKSIPYVVKPENINPAIPNYYASTYYDGVDFANIIVKTREGRPIFISGNTNSPVTKGGVTARVNSSVLSLYDTHRYKVPQSKAGNTSWADLDKAVVKGLEKAQADGKKIAILSNTIASPSTKAAIAEFSKAYSSAEGEGDSMESSVMHVQYDAVSYDGMRKANEMDFGTAMIPSYDFSKAKAIVSFDADFLGNWLNVNEHSPQYSSRRNPDGDWMSRHYQFETNFSLTGSNADVRGAIKPSERGHATVALYNAIASKTGGQKVKSSSFESDNAVMDKIQMAANDLLRNKGASLVVSSSNDVNEQCVVNGINQMLGNYGSTIDASKQVNIRQGDDAQVAGLISDMKAGNVGAVLIYGCNPAYTLPTALGFQEALAKVSLKVHIADRPDETSVLCDYSAADNHFLESWNDFEIKTGEFSLQQPAIRPLFRSRQGQASLLRWAKMENSDFYDFLTAYWEKNIFAMQSEEAYFKSFWNIALKNGMISMGGALEAQTYTSHVADAANKISKNSSNGWELALYISTAIGEGAQANNPHLQELPDPITRISWDNYITMNPSDMEDAGYETKTAQETPANLAKVTVGSQTLTLPVVASPGQKRQTIGIALGYGRTNTGKAGNGVGKNAYPFISLKNGSMSYEAGGVNIEATGEEYPIASIQTHHTMMGRKIVNETNLSSYKNESREVWNESAEIVDAFGDKKNVSKLDLWSSHQLETGHLWGLSIDLNSCTGCGACVTACHLNNNVPVVGKDEIRRTRSMTWLRIDRYYSSDADPKKNNGEFDYAEMENPSDYPQAVFQPVMCQHCNHAPCETVCPVAATTHSNEGFNQMTYNRCVGTRYCANNCPYKVRRFNWFNYQADSKFTQVNPAQDELARLVLNPDVVVRSRGVMEKCSLCIQDVQAGKLQAKKEGRPVQDGEIQTACSASCANGAIVFGDLNDNSEVAKRAQSERSYALLEEVGTRPNVSYLTKVRNLETEA